MLLELYFIVCKSVFLHTYIKRSNGKYIAISSLPVLIRIMFFVPLLRFFGWNCRQAHRLRCSIFVLSVRL